MAANDNGQPTSKMAVFPLTHHPGRFHVRLNEHVIGVLVFGKKGAEIKRLKVGIGEDGRGAFADPPGYMAKPYTTTGEAADKVLEHWLGLRERIAA